MRSRSEESYEEQMAEYEREIQQVEREIHKLEKAYAEEEEHLQALAQSTVGGWAIGSAADSWRSVDYVALRRAIHELVVQGGFSAGRAERDAAIERLADAEKMSFEQGEY